MKLTTPTKKEDILKAIVGLFEDIKKENEKFPESRYYYGRYTAMIDLLQMVHIRDTED